MNAVQKIMLEIDSINQLIADKIANNDFEVDMELEQQIKAVETLVDLNSKVENPEMLYQYLDKLNQFNLIITKFIKEESYRVKSSLMNIGHLKQYVTI